MRTKNGHVSYETVTNFFLTTFKKFTYFQHLCMMIIYSKLWLHTFFMEMYHVISHGQKLLFASVEK